MHQRKLKNFLIYPRFQLALLVANIAISSITLVIVHFSVYDVFNKLKNMGEKINLPIDHPYFSFIMHSKELMSIRLNWVFGISIFITAILSIYLSHKVVGPIYKLRKFFTELNVDQTLSKLYFRKGDYYDDLPKIVNDALNKFKK
jgi:hypothetical protein